MASFVAAFCVRHTTRFLSTGQGSFRSEQVKRVQHIVGGTLIRAPGFIRSSLPVTGLGKNYVRLEPGKRMNSPFTGPCETRPCD